MTNYKFSFILSLALHATLLGLMVFSFTWTVQATSIQAFAAQPVAIVEAVTVSQAQIENEITKLKEKENKQKQAETAAVKKLKEQADAAKAARVEEQKKLAELKQTKIKEELERKAKEKESLEKLQKLQKHQEAEAIEAAEKLNKIKDQQAAEEKRLQDIEQKTLLTKKKQDEEKKQLVELEKKRKKQEEDKLKKDADQLLQKELAAEQQQISAAKQRQWQTQIEKYTSLIIHAVGKHWLVPEGVENDISCVLLVRLGDGGEVLDVKLVRSSGYSQLDNSATAAVYKASPLPVPGDPELFEKFREIRLLVKPQGYLG